MPSSSPQHPYLATAELPAPLLRGLLVLCEKQDPRGWGAPGVTHCPAPHALWLALVWGRSIVIRNEGTGQPSAGL